MMSLTPTLSKAGIMLTRCSQLCFTWSPLSHVWQSFRLPALNAMEHWMILDEKMISTEAHRAL